MKNCPNCGVRNDNNATYCENCGSAIKSTSSSNNFLIIIIVIAIIIIGGIIGVIAFSSNSQNDNNIENNGNSFGAGSSNSEVSISSSGIALSEVPKLASKILSTGSNFQTMSIGSTTLSKNQCMYVLARAITMVASGQDGTIPINSYGSPSNPYGLIHHGTISKSQYVDMASRTYRWMDNNGATPNYTGISVPGKPDISPDDLLIIFADILNQYGQTGSLPSTVSF